MNADVIKNLNLDSVVKQSLSEILTKQYDRYRDVISFILSERLLTLTVIGSIFTFSLINSLKLYIIDPMLDYLLADENFNYMGYTLRDGIPTMNSEPRKIVLNFGWFFREFIKWLFVMTILFLCAKYTRFPDDPLGNISGSAVM